MRVLLDDPSVDQVPKKTGWVWLFGISVLVVTGLVVGTLTTSHQADLRAQESRISSLNDDLAGIDRARDDFADEVVSIGVGTDMLRVKVDTELIDEMLEVALNWSSHDSYVEARNALIQGWNIPEDSQFLTTYMPPAPGKMDAEGNFHSLIDARDLNSEFESSSVHVIGSVAGVYDYMVEVVSDARSFDGLGTSSTRSVVMVTVDPDGEMTNLRGFAVTSPTREA